ncbi:hypothetical protein D8Y16_01425 [Listeria seeligeri]|nr:hypothetical protein [Listeria seeligeri]
MINYKHDNFVTLEIIIVRKNAGLFADFFIYLFPWSAFTQKKASDVKVLISKIQIRLIPWRYFNIMNSLILPLTASPWCGYFFRANRCQLGKKLKKTENIPFYLVRIQANALIN